MSSSFVFNQDYNSDDEEQTTLITANKVGTVLIIDCSVSMFASSDDEDDTPSPFLNALSVLESFMLNNVANNRKDLAGVVLYNVEKSPEPAGIFKIENPLVAPKGCAVLMPMRQVQADMIQYVKNLIQSEDFMGFDDKFGHSKDTKIADVLWILSSMLSGAGKQFSISQVMWLSNEDRPHQINSTEYFQAFQKAKDLQQLRMIEVQFFPLKKDFDPEPFYNELFCQLLDEDPEDFQLPVVKITEGFLKNRMFRRGYKNRAISHLLVEVSDNVKFGIGIYSFTSKVSVPKPVSLSRDTKEPIVSKRSYKYGKVEEDPEEGGINLESEIDYSEKLESASTVKYQVCGGEKIKFTPLEAYEIKQVMEPKIKVLGFKPLTTLSHHNHLNSPYFIFPNDTQVKNSSVLFRALWERCLAENKTMICLFTMRLKSYPRLVALVPQEQTSSKDGEILRYDGFRMEFIPFAEDVRDLSDLLKAPGDNVQEALISGMSRIIGKLRINYSPSQFQNAVISKIYSKIEEQVFNEEANDYEDTTLPKKDAQDDRIKQFLEEVEQICGFDEEVVKRKASDGESGSSAPKKKALMEIDTAAVLEKCKTNAKDRALTLPILKSYLELKDVKGISKLNKGQCIEKILELE